MRNSFKNNQTTTDFGCICFPWLRPYTKHKLEDRSKECVFLGYSTTQRAYLCAHLPTGRLYLSQHVFFQETVFSFAAPTSRKSPISETEDHVASSPQPQVTPILVQQRQAPMTQASLCLDSHPSSSTVPSSWVILPQSQVSSSNSKTHFSSPSYSEPTVPSQNGPQPTA